MKIDIKVRILLGNKVCFLIAIEAKLFPLSVIVMNYLKPIAHKINTYFHHSMFNLNVHTCSAFSGVSRGGTCIFYRHVTADKLYGLKLN